MPAPEAPTPTAEPMRLDRADGSAMLELYRAALGPVRRDYYLKAFTRFDAQGRPGPSWNVVAGLLTLNWLAFRGLWAAALGYVGAVVFAALLLLGIGRVLFQLDDTAQWAVAAVVLLASVAVPGLWGNAWLYAALSKKMERALVDTATQEEACAALTAQAPGTRRAGMLLAANVLLAAALAAVLTRLPDAESLPLQTTNMEQARAAAAQLGTSGLAEHSMAAASAPTVAVASAPATPQADAAPISTPSAPAAPAAAAATESTAAPAARVSTGVVQMAVAPTPTPSPASPALKASAPAQIASAPAQVASSAQSTAQKPATAPAVAASAATAKPASALANAPVTQPAASAPAAASAASAPSAPLQKKEPAKQTATERANAQPPVAAGAYVINVGLFADANNARNATAKLRDADLPVQVSTLPSAKGPRTRVRVGPYETQVEADRAAEKIRSLKLEAQVVKP